MFALLQVKTLLSSSFIIFISLVSLCSSLSSTQNDADLELMSAGGKNAEEGQFPYEGYISYNGKHYCSVSIIHKNWVLTAAHCVEEELPNGLVTVGTIRLGEGVSYGIDKYFKHENYNTYKEDFPSIVYIVNDICLIRLDQPIEFNSLIQPVRIADNTSINYEGKWGTLPGWGTVPVTLKQPTNLQYVDFKIISVDECRKTFDYISDSYLCTSNKDGESACSGDSGGPLVVDGVQVAVMSASETTCQALSPSLFTRVSAYAEWIKSKLALYGDEL